MPERPIEPPSDSPVAGARFEMIDGRWTCVEVTLARPGAEITTAWIRSLPIATLVQRFRTDVAMPALAEAERKRLGTDA